MFNFQLRQNPFCGPLSAEATLYNHGKYGGELENLAQFIS